MLTGNDDQNINYDERSVFMKMDRTCGALNSYMIMTGIHEHDDTIKWSLPCLEYSMDGSPFC